VGRSLLTTNSTNGSWWMVQIRPTHIRAFGLIARSAPEDILMLNIPTFRPIGGAMFSPGSSARFARMNKRASW